MHVLALARRELSDRAGMRVDSEEIGIAGSVAHERDARAIRRPCRLVVAGELARQLNEAIARWIHEIDVATSSRSLANAICDPSGDHAGFELFPCERDLGESRAVGIHHEICRPAYRSRRTRCAIHPATTRARDRSLGQRSDSPIRRSTSREHGRSRQLGCARSCVLDP